jgi:hypothetical protein
MQPPTYWLLPECETATNPSLKRIGNFVDDTVRRTRVRLNIDTGAPHLLGEPGKPLRTIGRGEYRFEYGSYPHESVGFDYFSSQITYKKVNAAGKVFEGALPFYFAVPMDLTLRAFKRRFEHRYATPPTQSDIEVFTKHIADALRLYSCQWLNIALPPDNERQPRVYGFNGLVVVDGKEQWNASERALEVLKQVEALP